MLQPHLTCSAGLDGNARFGTNSGGGGGGAATARERETDRTHNSPTELLRSGSTTGAGWGEGGCCRGEGAGDRAAARAAGADS